MLSTKAPIIRRMTCGFWLVVQRVYSSVPESNSATAQRGSIGLATQRLLTSSSVVTWWAVSKAASTFALLSSMKPQSKQTFDFRSSWTFGASSATAAFMSSTAGSSSISKVIASAASSACSSVSATIAAMASPTWRTMPSARIGWRGSCCAVPSRLVTFQAVGREPASLKSSPVKTRSTPGIAAAAAVSRLRIFPCATSERRKCTWAWPGRLMSSV